MSNQRDAVFGGMFWKLMERFLAQGVSFVVSIVLARILMPELYGQVALVLIFITFADVLVSSGFSTSLIQKKDADELDFSTIFYCSLGVALLMYAVLYFTAPFIAQFFEMPSLTLVLRVFALRVPLGALNSIQHAYVSRHMLFRKFFFSTLGGTLFSGAVGIVMAVMGYGVWALVAQYLTNTLVDTIVLLFTVKWRPKLMFSGKRARELMSYGWKVLLADFSGTFFAQLRSFLIGKFYTESDLSFYNKGKQFTTLTTDNISAAILNVLFPAFSNNAKDQATVKGMLRKSIRVLCYIVMPLTLGMVAAAEPMVITLLTEKWSESIFFLQVLGLSAAIALVGNTSLQALKALGRSDVLLKLEFIKKPVYVILLIVGININVQAVAWTMLIYDVYALIINAGSLTKVVGYKPLEQLRDVRDGLLLSLGMAIPVWCVNLIPIPYLAKLIIMIVLGMILYVILSASTGCDSYLYLKDFVLDKLKGKGIYDRLVMPLRRRQTIFYPIKKNRVVFMNFLGKGPGDSPGAISSYMDRNIDKGLDLVWLVNDVEAGQATMGADSNIRFVKFGSSAAWRELMTARVWVDDVRNTPRPKKKKNQYYLQTWHGGFSFKYCEEEPGANLDESYLKAIRYDGTITDALTSSDARFSALVKKYFSLPDNVELLENGFPRDDIYYDEVAKHRATSDKEGIEILYAPTFRDDGSTDCYKLDFDGIIGAFERLTGEKCKLLLRLHPNVPEEVARELTASNSKIINMTANPNGQEVILRSDYLITDFSSIANDMAFILGRPVFLYAKDYEDYVANRGIRKEAVEFPYVRANSMEELIQKIEEFSLDDYTEKLDSYVKNYPVFGEGVASAKAASWIMGKL